MTHYKNTMQQLVDKIKATSKDEYLLDYVDQLERMDFDFDYFEFNSANDMIEQVETFLKINAK